MTFFANGNGGVNGTNVTTSDSGSGNNWNTVEVDTDDRFEYTTDAYLGGMGYRYSTVGASVGGRVIATHTAAGAVHNRAYLKLPAVDSTTRMFIFRDTVGGNQGCHISVNASEQLRIGNGDFSTVFTSSALTVGTWYRIEIWYSATALKARLQIFVGEAGNPTQDSGEVAVTQTGAFSTVGAIYVGSIATETNRPSATGFINLDELVLFHPEQVGPAIPDPVFSSFPRRGIAAAS